MFASCHSPLWRVDDFSECFLDEYVRGRFPSIVCSISIICLSLQISAAIVRRRRSGRQGLLDNSSGTNATAEPESVYHDDPQISAEGGNANGTAVKKTEDDLVVVVDKPKAQLTRALVEAVIILAELVIHAIHDHTSHLRLVLCWTYVALLGLSRLLLSRSSWRDRAPTLLWYHTGFLYAPLWLLATVSFRSALIRQVDITFAAVDFSLTTLLFLIGLTSREGNKTVRLEYEGALFPSREQTASILSLATFSWADRIVWTGYRKTVELSDVWNVIPSDKSATVLFNYHQVKKTSALTWHLLRHFKKELTVQALWSGLSGFLTFAPTLLLKAIMEYVEDPVSKPRNVAWLYVILLFVSGCVTALADGQSLWIGRKVCIRLRSIIIGEIYNKALRRRVANAPEKVLGAESPKDAEESEGLLSRIKSWFTKKADSDQRKDDNAKGGEEDSQVSSGAIINLMSVDSFKVADTCAYLHFLWAATPVEVFMSIYLLYRILGLSSIAGLVIMGLLLPVNFWIARMWMQIQKKLLAATDGRINLTNEVLGNIRVIKYFAWEDRFVSQVGEKRKAEMHQLKRHYVLWAAASTIWSGAPILITFLSFYIYTVIEKKALVPSIAFTALSLFQILRIPLDQLADMVAHVQESKVSVDRVEEYLNEPETDKYNLVTDKTNDDGNPRIGFVGASYTWATNTDSEDLIAEDAFKVMDLNLEFSVDRLNLIVGPTGSGKTSLIMALLGEMTRISGTVFLPCPRTRDDLEINDKGLTNSIAYCAQQAWLANDTIKQNILFASPWDEGRYKMVVHACSLERDLEILDEGDETLVGEKGVTLSGGQKQRISLARALYCPARHLLLDDVLSAVDSHTAKWIFNNALRGPLLRDRTCILATHNISLCLPSADFVVVLDNGRVTAQGKPDDVRASGRLPSEQGGSQVASSKSSITEVAMHSVEGSEGTLTVDGDNQTPRADGTSDGGAAKHSDSSKSQTSGDTSKPKSKAKHEEKKAEGSVKLGIILLYLKAMGPWYFWIAAGSVFVLQQLSSVATNVWIRQWANAYVRHDFQAYGAQKSTPINRPGTLSGLGTCLRSGTCVWGIPSFGDDNRLVTLSEETKVNVSYYLGVYAVLGLIYTIITFSREIVLFQGSLSASRRIHDHLIESVTRAKFRFFDTTPIGQLMNRFSKDMEDIDQEIAPVAVGVVHCSASILTIVILISIITPGFLLAGVFITILYFIIGKFYISSSRDLKRLEAIERSPLFQQFGETLSGMTTIRAYADENRFIRENMHRVNTHNRPFIFLWATNRWLAVRVDIVGALVSFFSAMFVVLSVGHIDPGAAGLALTYAVTFTENVLWFVRLYASNEQNMNSVERIREYLEVEREAAPIVDDNRTPPNWPLHGAVEFVKYSTKYRKDLDLVLKKITFKIQPGEKVGVVGRTGAGKSSLALALFRAIEAEEGSILVDGIDIGLIGLQDLRENIVMVPQDPTLFTGTIRSNLDPFNRFTDEDIFTALRRVHLIGSRPSTAASSVRRQPTAATAQDTLDHSLLDTVNAMPGPDESTIPEQATISGAPAVTLQGTRTHEATAPIITLSPSSTHDPLSPPVPDRSNNDNAPPIPTNKNIFSNLSSPISESGSNLSQGQRQLLCLARALLSNPKVLLMDEATASVDYATDAAIQETLRENKNTTITIAHRLRTIVDYDRVVVLDAGEVVEWGAPWELLADSSSTTSAAPPSSNSAEGEDGEGGAVIRTGAFRAMCQTSGEMEELMREAKKAYFASSSSPRTGTIEDEDGGKGAGSSSSAAAGL